jgi:hypothetical protein
MTIASPATAPDHATEATPFRFIATWPHIEAHDAEAIRAFWKREGAILDDAQIAQRLPQVVMYARAADGEVAAVCTAVAVTPPRLEQPLYYFRAFIGRRWRSSRLVFTLLRRACALLEAHARAHDFPCIGILLELENERFRARGRGPIWPNPDFIYVGKSERGLEMRVHYFRGARLK